MKRKLLSQMILGLLLTGTLVPLFNIRQANASAWIGESGGRYLGMSVSENLTVLQDGSAKLSILMNIPSSPLADMYRKMLGVPSDALVEQEMEIPENVVKVASGIASTGISVPVKEEFIDPLMKEQLLSLGLKAEIDETSMVPRGHQDEMRISLRGHAEFEVFDFVQDDSSDIWEIALGPFNKTGITGIVFSRLIFTQLMLGSIEGDAVYGSTWLTRITLPTGSDVLNGNEFLGKSWLVDFGGGTFLRASTTLPWQLDGTSTFLVNEEMMITKNDITASPEQLHEALSNYKAFNIRYSLPRSVESAPNSGIDENVNTNWDWTRSSGWIPLPEISFSKTYENETVGYSLELKLTLMPKFRITQFIGWQFSWALAWPPIQTDWFEARTTLESSTQIRFEVNASYNPKEWVWPIYRKQLWTFSFYFGVPVWIDVKLGIDAVLRLDAEASFVLTTVVNSTITAGIRWDKKTNPKWQPIFQPSFDIPTLDELAWAVYAEVTVTPSLRFRLEFLFYSVAGPYVELEPYVTFKAETILSPTNDTVDLDFTFGYKINVGVIFAGWIKDILRAARAPNELIEGIRLTLFDEEIWHWNQSFVLNWTSSQKEHDLSIANVSLPEIVSFVGEDLNLSVIARNDGDFNETSDVKFFQDGMPITTITAIDLSPSDSVSLHFVWNTSGLSPDTYSLRFEVANVTGEDNLGNNFNVLNVTLVEHNDVEVTDASATPDKVYAGQKIVVTISLKNIGDVDENVNLAAFINETAIIPETPIQVMLGETITMTFVHALSTSLTPGQTVVMWANISTAHYDVNVTNNIFYGSILKVKMLGDLNGDDRVDMQDIGPAASAFGTAPESARWNPNADLNFDSKVNLVDIALLAKNFGRSLS